MNPKSVSHSAISMEELEKSIRDVELLHKQQALEHPEKNPKSVEELAKVFGELEQAYAQVEEDPEKVMCEAKKVLDMLLLEEKVSLAPGRSLTIVLVLNMLGFASMYLKSFDQSLKYFNWADTKLNEVLEEGSVGGGSSSSSSSLPLEGGGGDGGSRSSSLPLEGGGGGVSSSSSLPLEGGGGGVSSSSSLPLEGGGGGGSSTSSLRLDGGGGSRYRSLSLEDGGSSSFGSLVVDVLIEQIHGGLSMIKKEMGKKEDCPHHLKKVLEVKERTMEEGCVDLGESYKDLYKAYLRLFECEEALPYCLKALDIYTRHKGEESEEVAMIRRDLGVIYAQLKDYDSALEHNQLASSVLECATDESGIGLLMADLQKGFILSQIGKHEEAVSCLKVVLARDTLDTGSKVLAFTAMGIALCGQEKFGEAKKFVDAAREILDKKDEMPTLLEASELWDLAVLYQRMKDNKTAAYVLRKILKTPELPKDDLLMYYRGFHALVFRTDTEEEELPHLEEAVERLKESFGPKHVEVGYGNCDLGFACLTLRKRHEAVKYFENAKEILDVSLGPRHIKSLKISETLSKAYAATGRFDLAIPCQEKVVEGMIAAGPSELENLTEAVGLLRAMQSDVVSGGTH